MNIVNTRGGVLEDVLGLEDILEDRFWSSWPWPRSLKSSKIALSSARGQHYLLNCWNFVGKRQKLRRKFAKTFFCFPQVEIAWKKILKTLFLKTFFAWKKFLKIFFLKSLEKNFWRPSFFLENICACVLGPWPWPRVSLSLALAPKFFCVLGLGLGLKPCVLDSTSCKYLHWVEDRNKIFENSCLYFPISAKNCQAEWHVFPFFHFRTCFRSPQVIPNTPCKFPKSPEKTSSFFIINPPSNKTMIKWQNKQIKLVAFDLRSYEPT